MDNENYKERLYSEIVFDTYNSRGHELNLSEVIQNAADAGQDLDILSEQLAQQIGPIETEVVVQEPSTASPVTIGVDEIAAIILRYGNEHRSVAEKTAGAKEWWCLTCGASKSPEAMEDCHAKGHKLEVLDKTADTNQSSEGDAGASGDVEISLDSTRTSGGEDNAEIIRMQTEASGKENAAPFNQLLAKAWTLAGFEYDVANNGDVNTAWKDLPDGKKWIANPSEDTDDGVTYLLMLGDRDEITAKILDTREIFISRQDMPLALAYSIKKLIGDTSPLSADLWNKLDENLRFSNNPSAPIHQKTLTPENIDQIQTLTPQEMNQKKDKLLDRLNELSEDDPQRENIKKQLQALGRLIHAKEKEEPRSNGDTDGLYSEWSDSKCTDGIVEDYVEQLKNGLPSKIKGNIAHGWDKEPWMLQDTKFAESYQAAFSPEEWFKNIQMQGLEDELNDALREKAYEDSDAATWAWEAMTEDLTNLMDTINPGSSVWRVNMRGFGWLSQDDDGTITAESGEDLLHAILPNTDCSFKVYKKGRGIVINNAHHDKPMGGEMYYITPFDATPPNPEETPVERQYAQAPELAEQITEEHERRKERSRPKEVNAPVKLTPKQMEDAPETANDLGTLSPQEISQKRDTLLDRLNTLPENDPKRNQIMEQIKSLGRLILSSEQDIPGGIGALRRPSLQKIHSFITEFAHLESLDEALFEAVQSGMFSPKEENLLYQDPRIRAYAERLWDARGTDMNKNSAKAGKPIAEGIDPQGRKLQLLELEEKMATRGRYMKWLLVDVESGETLQEAGPLYLDDPRYNDAALHEARHNAYQFLAEQTMGNLRDLRAARQKKDPLDAQIEQAYYKNCAGTQIDIMDISKLFADARAAVQAGGDLEQAVIAAIQKYKFQANTEGNIMGKKKILDAQVSGMKLTRAQKAIVADMESHIEDYTEEFLNTVGQIMKQDWDPGSSWSVVEADGIAKLVRQEIPVDEPEILSKHSYRQGQELRIDAGILPEDVVVVALLGESRYKVRSAYTDKVFTVDEADLYNPKEDGIFTDGTGLSIGDIANLF